MKKLLFALLLTLLMFNGNAFSDEIEREMGKAKPEFILACKAIKDGVETDKFILKRGFNKTSMDWGETWYAHFYEPSSDEFLPANDFLTSLDEKTYAWADEKVSGSDIILFISVLELEDKDLSSDKNQRSILQEFAIFLPVNLEVSQELIKTKKILLNSKTKDQFKINILDHHFNLQKAQKYAMMQKIKMLEPYVSACYKE